MAAPVPTIGRTPSLLRSAVEYSIGSGLGLLGSILRVGFAARILSSEQRGLWLGLQLGYSYSQNLHIGAVYGMLRMVPMLRARGDIPGAEAAKSTTAGFTLAMSGIGAVALAIYAFFTPDADYRRYLLLTGLLAFATLVRSYFVTVFKGESRFRDVSIAATIGSATSLISVSLIWLAGLDGLIWGMILQAACEIAWFVRKETRVALSVDPTILRELLQVGVMTLAVTVGTLMLSSVDRTVMLSRLGTTATGFYYIGANIVALLPAVAALPADVLTPKFFEAYGRTSRGESLVPLVERPVQAGSVLFAACLGVGTLALPAVVARLSPGLLAGVDAARIAALGTFPVVMASLVTKVFYAMNRQLIQIVILGLSAGVGFLCAHGAVNLSPTIAAAAAGSVVGLTMAYVATLLVAYRLMVRRWYPGLVLLAQSLIPAVAAVACVLTLDAVLGRWMPPGSIRRGLLSEVLFSAAFAPWIVRELRRLRRRSLA